jgi:hypothetical protein
MFAKLFPHLPAPWTKRRDALLATDYTSFFIQPQQIDVPVGMLNGIDYAVWIPCAGGKSMIVYLLAAMLPLGEVLLYVAPLKVLGQQMLENLAALGIRAERLRDLSGPLPLGVRVILVAMEELTDARKKMLLNKTQWQLAVSAVIVDEVHLFPLWSVSFRPQLSEVYHLRLLFRHSVPLAVLSGSPPPFLRKNIAALFCMRLEWDFPNLPPRLISEDLTLPRIVVSIMVEKDGWKADLDAAFSFLGLSMNPDHYKAASDFPQVMVHVRGRSQAVTAALYHDLLNSLREKFGKDFSLPLHSGNTDKMVERVSARMRSGTTRVCVATMVLNAGFHTPNVQHSVILGSDALGLTGGRMPTAVQIVARGGLRGQQQAPVPPEGCHAILVVPRKVLSRKNVAGDDDFKDFMAKAHARKCIRQSFADFLQCCPSHSFPKAGCCMNCDPALRAKLGSRAYPALTQKELKAVKVCLLIVDEALTVV